jgi:membrane associated rhomboid family serine protease
MLSDRHYMRDRETPISYDPTHWIMGSLVAMFLVEHVLVNGVKSNFLFEHFSFSIDHLKQGQFWTLLSYNFIPDIRWYGGIPQLLFNLFALHFWGRAIIAQTSRQLFVIIYFGLILAGALTWSAGSVLKIYGPIWDASIAAAGVFALFCCFHANDRITFFWLPVTLKPKHLAWIWAGVDLFGFVFYEMLDAPSDFWMGHLARLGAMAAAAGFYFIYEHQLKYGQALAAEPAVELPHWMRKTPRAARPPGYRVNLSNRDDLRAEVDRILDKINSEGFGALTADEKQVLDEAKDLLSRR